MTASRLKRISVPLNFSMRAWIWERARPSQFSSVHSPWEIGPLARPSNSYNWPLNGTYEIKWKASSSLPVDGPYSMTKGSWRAKELWDSRILSEFPIVRPFSLDGSPTVKFLKLSSSGPIVTSLERFSRMERIAWVAQALFMT